MENGIKLSLSSEELESIRFRLGREPIGLELAIIDAEWSEHCSYKSSKLVLKQLPTLGPHVLIGPGFDAGVLDVGDGYVVTLHIESHNHPSAIDPYGGAATGVGGILRDILCMNTRPIALLNSLHFGRIDESAHSRWLFKNVVRGISDYGNCVGVPDVGGELEFDESFERNCLVDVVCVGLGKRDSLILAEARRLGDKIIVVGGLTGRDGIHGATFASRDLAEDSDADRSSVQIPDPFTEKLIIEASLEAVATGMVHGLKDLGGGGLACGLSEVAEKGDSGVHIDVSKIPVREHAMSPAEIMISESQERMLFIIDPDAEEVFEVFKKYGLPYSVIGEVSDSRRFVIFKNHRLLADIPVDLVANAPSIQRRAVKPSYIDEYRSLKEPVLHSDLSGALVKLLSSPNISSRRWVYEQYDHEVGVRTVVKPGEADSAVLRLPNERFLALTVDGNSKHCYLDPYNGAAGCVAEACRNLASVGAKPIAMVDHLQFGNPGNPEVFWTFSEAVRGMADYCKNLGIPCVGGKVSFYNEDLKTGLAIKPSPVIAMIGLIENASCIRRMDFNKRSHYIMIIGETQDELGGSEHYEYIHNFTGGVVPKVDYTVEALTLRFVREAIIQGLVESIHDCSKGGLAVALAEMCIKGGIGADLRLDLIPSSCRSSDHTLFSESHARFILGVEEDMVEPLTNLASRSGVVLSKIGAIGGDSLTVYDKNVQLLSLKIDRMKSIWEQAIPKIMGE